MRPELRKGPLFYKTPPFSTFFYKKTPPNLISCLRACTLNCLECTVIDDVTRVKSTARETVLHTGIDELSGRPLEDRVN